MWHLQQLWIVTRAAGIAEWEKTLLTAMAGFFTGLLAEPIKLSITNKYKKLKIRRLCYEQIFSTRNAMKAVLTALDKRLSYQSLNPEGYARFMVLGLNIGALRYALNEESATIYQLDIAPTAANIIQLLSGLTPSSSDEEIRNTAESIIMTIDRHVAFDMIDGSYLTKVALRHVWQEKKQYRKIGDDGDPLRFGYRDASMWERAYTYRPFIGLMGLRIKRIRQFWKTISSDDK
jgi:hypothetical protein